MDGWMEGRTDYMKISMGMDVNPSVSYVDTSPKQILMRFHPRGLSVNTQETENVTNECMAGWTDDNTY